MIGEGECQDFMRDCVKRLLEETEFLVYYGINSKGLNPPRSPQFSKFPYFLNFSLIWRFSPCHFLIYLLPVKVCRFAHL